MRLGRFLMLAAERCHPHFQQRSVFFDHLQKTLCAGDSLVDRELVHPLRVAKRQNGHKFQPGFLYSRQEPQF